MKTAYILLSIVQALLGLSQILSGLTIVDNGYSVGYFFVGLGSVFLFVGIKDIILPSWRRN